MITPAVPAVPAVFAVFALAAAGGGQYLSTGGPKVGTVMSDAIVEFYRGQRPDAEGRLIDDISAPLIKPETIAAFGADESLLSACSSSGVMPQRLHLRHHASRRRRSRTGALLG